MNNAGVKILAGIVGFWVIMRSVRKSSTTHKTLIDTILGQSGSANVPLPGSSASAALAGNVTSTSAKTSSLAQLQPAMDQIARRYGWNAGQISAWQQVISKESGGNSTVLGQPTIPGNNTPGISRAFGIGQFLGTTFTQYLGPYGGTAATPAEQLQAMAAYIRARYGTPSAAQLHEVSAGWY